MANSQVAYGGEGLPMWKMVLNILDKYFQGTTSDDPSVWGFGKGLTTSDHKKAACSEILHRVSD
jgi:hypothetical protein